MSYIHMTEVNVLTSVIHTLDCCINERCSSTIGVQVNDIDTVLRRSVIIHQGTWE